MTGLCFRGPPSPILKLVLLFLLSSQWKEFSREVVYYLPKQSYRYTGNIWDVACYFSGGVVFLFVTKKLMFKKKWHVPIRKWGIVLNQFLIIYEKGSDFIKVQPRYLLIYRLSGIGSATCSQITNSVLLTSHHSLKYAKVYCPWRRVQLL